MSLLAVSVLWRLGVILIEEPCEGKPSSTVLKTNGVGDNLVEFNIFEKKAKEVKPDVAAAEAGAS